MHGASAHISSQGSSTTNWRGDAYGRICDGCSRHPEAEGVLHRSVPHEARAHRAPDIRAVRQARRVRLPERARNAMAVHREHHPGCGRVHRKSSEAKIVARFGRRPHSAKNERLFLQILSPRTKRSQRGYRASLPRESIRLYETRPIASIRRMVRPSVDKSPISMSCLRE